MLVSSLQRTPPLPTLPPSSSPHLILPSLFPFCSLMVYLSLDSILNGLTPLYFACDLLCQLSILTWRLLLSYPVAAKAAWGNHSVNKSIVSVLCWNPRQQCAVLYCVADLFCWSISTAQPTPVSLPGESQGRGSLVGCRLWGRTESDTTEVT